MEGFKYNKSSSPERGRKIGNDTSVTHCYVIMMQHDWWENMRENVLAVFDVQIESLAVHILSLEKHLRSVSSFK